ncbi:MAG: twin-arginine translocation signal domain-containing protein [Nitrospira sp.]|nr:twin-arginine translocation signal domain-containing protein [Nitrospira sp.]
MAITRRDFLKYTAVAGGALLFGVFDLDPIKAYAEANPPVWTTEALSVGVYCSGGCGVIVGSVDGSTITGGTAGKKYVVYVQGNPDSPINGGGLCSKCASSAQISTIVDPTLGRIPNPERITTVKYRAAGASVWTDKPYATAINEIAAKVKATRDANFTETEGALTVNRCNGIATLGGSSLNNEAAYLIGKLNRGLGVVYLETQARN